MKTWRFRICIVYEFGRFIDSYIECDVSDVEYYKLYETQAHLELSDIDEDLYERIIVAAKEQEIDNVRNELGKEFQGDSFKYVEIMIFIA